MNVQTFNLFIPIVRIINSALVNTKRIGNKKKIDITKIYHLVLMRRKKKLLPWNLRMVAFKIIFYVTS